MSQVFRQGDPRQCGAINQVIGQTSFFVNGLLASVEGDIDSHGGLGQLIQQNGPGNIFINGLKLITVGDRGAPDIQGMIMHPFCPTGPAAGSTNFFAYDGLAGGGLAEILSGKLNIFENLLMNGNVIGQVKNILGGLTSGTAGQQGQLVLQNMGTNTPGPNDILTGAETGATVRIVSFTRSSTYDRSDTLPDYIPIMDVAITDDTNVIAMPEHFTGYASQDYQSEHIIVT